MHRVLKAAFILLLSLGMLLQGLSVFVLAPAQQKKTILAENCSAAPTVVVKMTVPVDVAGDCCNYAGDHDEPLESELPVFWELDTHDATLEGLHAASLGNVEFPARDNHFFPSLSYDLHRPPDLLS